MRQQFYLPHFANGLPLTATVREVLPLFQLCLDQGAGVAVLVNAIGEVLAGHADHASLPVLQVAVFDEVPLLQDHHLSSVHLC